MSNVNSPAKRKTAIASVYCAKQDISNIVLKENRPESFLNVDIQESKVTFHSHQVTLEEKTLLPLKILHACYSGFNPIVIKARVSGGGVTGQKEALQLAIAKCLVNFLKDQTDICDSFKRTLRCYSLLTSDSRIVERNKPGHVKARKKQAFKKR